MADNLNRPADTATSPGQGNPLLPNHSDNSNQTNRSGSTREGVADAASRAADNLTGPDDDTTMVDNSTLTTPGTVDTSYDNQTTARTYPSTGVGAAAGGAMGSSGVDSGLALAETGAMAAGTAGIGTGVGMSGRYYSPNEGREHISGLFANRSDAEDAVQRLESLGVSRSDISVILRNESDTAEFAATTGTEVGSRAGEGAGAGSVVGGTVGAILGALAATATSVAIPGVGVLLAGPIAGALAGAGAGGLAGGLLGALVGAGIPEETARTYETGLQQGGVVVVADVPSHLAAEARRILNVQGSYTGV